MAYESILTNVGRQKIASATPEHQLKINRLAVGDGNGGYSPLDPDMNSLVNEVWRGPASAPIRDRNDPTILIFEAIIPPDVGGFFIREAGIFDDTGDLIAVGHTAQIEKPDDSSGSPISLTVRFRVQLENADHFDLIYNDQAPIDHDGITNRDAPDSHPISAITGLQNALNAKADKSIFVFAGTGLRGGGALSSNVTLSVDFGTGAGKVTEGNDERLSNAREWTAETVSQAEAEAGTSTTRRAWTAQRVRQATVAGYNALTSAFGRTLANASNAAAARNTLELGTAATRDVTTSPTDTTPGRLLKVGDFGIGETIRIPEGANLNDYITPGEYRQGASANAIPELNYPAQLAGSLKVMQAASGVVQEYTTFGHTRRKFLRGLYIGSWSSWVEFYHTGNIAQLISDGNLVPASRTISTGTGLTGGGDLSANRTISIDPNYDASLVKTSRTISTGTGLTGGGNLSANRTISIDPNYDASLVKTSRTISTGTGLTGGGDLSANRTISIANSHIPIGVGQTWQDVKGSRSLGTTYTNTTGRAIMVSISLPDTNNKTPTVTINVGGVDILVNTYDGGNNLGSFSHSFIVPAGATYRISVNDSVGITTWTELR